MQTHPSSYPTDLSDDEWNQIKSLIPAPKSGKGKRGRPRGAGSAHSGERAFLHGAGGLCLANAAPRLNALVSMYGRLQIIWADDGYLGTLVNWVKQLRPFGKLRL